MVWNFFCFDADCQFSIAVLQLPRTVPVINENALADEASKKDAHGPADGPEAEREEPRAS
jgi:hypothetical protein